jgi:hypothetical protein
MVKAVFHKNQRVFVRPVGTWATVERVIPQWVKGVEEPLKIHYDCGLGREFSAHELAPEQIQTPEESGSGAEWRVLRARNRWQSAEETSEHPVPGTHPVIVTGKDSWGGWRIPGAEYDQNPSRFEWQARLIAAAPRLMSMTRTLIAHASGNPQDTAHALMELAKEANGLLNRIDDAAEAVTQIGRLDPKAAAHTDPDEAPSTYVSPALRRRPVAG